MTALRTGEGLTDVVVTALTSTTALGPDAEDTWQQILQGGSGIRQLDKWFVRECDSPVRIGGALREDFDHHLNRVELRRLSYLGKMGTVLGRRLWGNADSPDIDTGRLLVSIGLALGSTEEIAVQYGAFQARGLRAMSPLAIQMYMPNAAAAAVGLERKAKAGVIAPLMSDASGAAAIAQAWRHIVMGEADIAICGAVESWVEPVPVAAFDGLGIMSTNNDDPAGACRPFDRHRDGMVLGEGGALMLIETEDHAKARGAPILARLMGASTNSDAYDHVQSDPTGETAGAAIARAIELAGLRPSDIDHVNAHATGTTLGDLAEARAIRRAFQGHQPAVYAPKAVLGHSLGAAGAVEAVLTVQALRDGVLPATRNVDDLDPEIDLDVVIGRPRRANYQYAISNSLGLGGNNVVLTFGAA
ncbi:3-oxoacyl-[acyl-carrier-protein] synthase II/beta-ketoacyl ACP synthase [Mycolicibacterium sp. BK556]|uniref:KasA/KasB family beta-ketoacyl-ACP synthase n=1 Tax=Mycobacteriaceae TaxID=1762 RepID=UPI00105C5B4B|nr:MULTISPECIES: KasA/KasB family beta-ketoacyl-ACP synthase [Mycobacteriaceae]MBB3605387.1 3-oxoacyl-[acyl-carrier-protein] synthase II/beta-ketoacyl ACP synthase [Mycolicibacterium sp. BK556]MBB3635583.1 3-oxoacyl-[acyl-carrier-protein] synthase II/beta-ketoacyl ACP synthase [Mycolicibacterium sp. BK607]MBB3747626.1 3-oxoacyl-[acyl-carrier-protein] synthase II/beta-ketoacyl ACP synthase [Mycolicibacterium sp. BK634]TDO08236.1 3-oxoacyl-[acyl-carrier-protein] synthase II/beta-ketoacyl ACP synt